MSLFGMNEPHIETMSPEKQTVSRFQDLTWEHIYANVGLVQTAINTLSDILSTCYFKIDTPDGERSYVCWLPFEEQRVGELKWVILPQGPQAFLKQLVEISPPESFFSLEELIKILPEEALNYHKRIEVISLYQKIASEGLEGVSKIRFSQRA